MQGLAPSLVALLASCSTACVADVVEKPGWKRHFDARGLEGTFVLYQPAQDRYLVYDEPRARHGYLPASTFKIPNALIGLEVGSIRDENEVFKWDGKPKPRRAWERDHTLDSGMQESVVWMFQEVARRTGKARMRAWVKRFEYGNQDIGGGIELFWLQGAMRISAFGQVEFLRKLEEGRLPVSARSRRLVRDALLVEKSGAYALYAKTGTTGAVREPVMWWVGWVEKGGAPVAYFAMNATLTADARFGDRFPVSLAILREEGVLPGAKPG